MTMPGLWFKRKQFCLGFICVMVFLGSCAQVGQVVHRMRAKYPVEVTAEMRAQFDLAEFHYRRRHFDEANQFYQEYITRYGHNALTDEAYYKQGKLSFLKRDFAAAISRLETLARISPSESYRAKAWHLGAYSTYKMGDYPNTLKSLKKVREAALPAKLRLQYYSVLINAAQAANLEADLAQYAALRLYDLYHENAQTFRYLRAPDLINYADSKRRVDAWMTVPLSTKKMPLWIHKYPSGAAKPYVDFKLAKAYFEANKQKNARRLLTLFVQSYPKNEYHNAASGLLSRLGGPEELAIKKPKDVAFKLGVLAPMSGQRGSYGLSVLQGVKCAVGVEGLCEGNSRVELVARDSGETGDGVKEAMNELKSAGVVAVVGILPGELAVEGALAASEQKLPLFMISQKSKLMQQGDHVFQMGLTTEQQVAELVKAARDRGHKNFAVFYPSIRYGITMTDLFEKEVKAQGGRLVVKTPYERRTPDLFAEARKLKTDARLSGGASFDAIFIPDTYAAVNALVGALEFNGIKGMALLGTNTWNHPGLSARRIEEIFPGSFFVDLYDAGVGNAENQDFRKRFMANGGEEPQVLQALGYDAAAIVKQIVSAHGERHLYENLTNSVSFKGVTGVRGFKMGEGPVIVPHVIELKTFQASPAE